MSSLVVVEKPNGKLRICIDPVHLNKALKQSHYPLPVIEGILPELADVKVFSKADLKDGFLHIELDNKSSLLTTFQTPWGHYCRKWLPFGIDTFHRYIPLFNSKEFLAFATIYEFQHITSSPEYHQSNGKVENAVKTSKNLMKKAATTNSDFQLALLDWRNTLTNFLERFSYICLQLLQLSFFLKKERCNIIMSRNFIT